MNTPWRPALLALRRAHSVCARFLPLLGILVGAIGGGVYWLAARFWPSNVAVVLSLFATHLLSGTLGDNSFGKIPPAWADLFALLIKYNALMALTAANMSFSLPANLALGLIMVCGHAASHALAGTIPAARPPLPRRVPSADLAIALAVGFAPATLLGIPGLAGLGAAIVMRLGTASHVDRRTTALELSEASFYLGALATWKYV